MKNLSTKRNNTLAVVIVSFNTYDLLQHCINSLEKYSDIFCDVYIVDNGSTDGSIEYINKVSEQKLKNVFFKPLYPIFFTLPVPDFKTFSQVIINQMFYENNNIIDCNAAVQLRRHLCPDQRQLRWFSSPSFCRPGN